MPGYWDLRDVLHIDPDSQSNCVGEAKTYGRRCKVRISVSDLRTASRLLNEMDRSKRIAPEDLEELAALLLCKNFHNCRTKPHLNQIEEVSDEWNEMIAEEYSRVKKQKEKEERVAAEKLRSEIRESMKEVRESMGKVRDDSKMEELDKIHQAKPFQSNTFAPSSREKIDDPFETQTSSSTRPNIFTRPSPQSDAWNMATLPDDVPAAQNKESSVAEGKKAVYPFGMPYMPSAPTHEPSSRAKESRIAIAEQQETDTTPLNNSDTITMSKFAFAFGSKSASTVPAFQFETPTKARITQVEAAPTSGSQNVPAFSAFPGHLGASTSPTAPISEAKEASEVPKRIASQEKPAKPMNVALSKNSGVSYEFGSRDKTLSSAFEFEAPLKPQQPAKINDSTASHAILFKVTQLDDNGSKTPPTSAELSKHGEESDLPPSTLVNDPQPSSIETSNISTTKERPTTPLPKEESFGYANITPNSTRYTTTYLPARQQHGLVTPPETPEMLVRALGKPMDESDYLRDERPRQAGSPVPRVARKPLPTSPSPRMSGEGEARREVCPGYESRAGLGVGKCRCEEVSEEVEIRTGCLARFGFRRLKEKIMGKLKAGKGRNSRKMGQDFIDSNYGTALE